MPQASKKKIEYNAEYDSKNYQMLVIHVKEESEVIRALEKCVEQLGISKSDYVKQAIEEKLNQDDLMRRQHDGRKTEFETSS